MVVFIRDAFAEGSVEGFEDYVTLLFINRPVQEICRQAGVSLNIIHECDEENLPSPIGRLVATTSVFDATQNTTDETRFAA